MHSPIAHLLTIFYPTIIPKSSQAALPGMGKMMRGQSEHHLIGVPLIFPVPFLPPLLHRRLLYWLRSEARSGLAFLNKGAKYCREVGMDISRTVSAGTCSATVSGWLRPPSARAPTPVAPRSGRGVQPKTPNSGVVRRRVACSCASRDETSTALARERKKQGA